METYLLQKDDGHYITFSPKIFGQVKGTAYVAIKLYWIEFWFYLDAQGYKINPFMFESMWGIDNPNKFCYGLGWFQDFFDLGFRVS